MRKKKIEDEILFETVASPESTSVREATYYLKPKVLVLWFGKTNTKYKYEGFRPEDWQAYKSASSKGKFVHSFIVPNYKGVQI